MSFVKYITSGVKAIALSKDQGCAEPNLENVVSKKYPLGRYLYLYVNKEPNSSLDPLRLEFLKYIMSVEGQEIVIKDGYLPLPASVISDIMGQIGG